MTIKFGTDGWRAVISENFTFHNLRLVSQAIADFVLAENGGEPSVVVVSHVVVRLPWMTLARAHHIDVTFKANSHRPLCVVGAEGDLDDRTTSVVIEALREHLARLQGVPCEAERIDGSGAPND